jgi:hypothetical protein
MRTQFICAWDNRYAIADTPEKAYDYLCEDYEVEAEDCTFYEVHPLNVSIVRTVNYTYKE